ncbi:MAG TPA: insulinase family protein [Spirochaetia bacterium]|nr:insulinase family protein [Spirochaetales bacterium]HRS66468.1 insulinase family protein [Spirochaetia bacterium]
MKKTKLLNVFIIVGFVVLGLLSCVGTQTKGSEAAQVQVDESQQTPIAVAEVQQKYDPYKAQPDDLLPLAPELTKGVFDNGLTYYVRKNGNPAKRAVMYLVVKAGSVHETDEERGYAHFVEHMAFNGTKSFPENQLVDYFRSIGMEFGAEVNAYTSFDRTVYMIKMPLDKLTFYQKGLQILKEFALDITFDPVEVEKEKGVILEEMRLDKGSRERASNRELEAMLGGTPYSNRSPIGTEASIKNATAEKLKAFYLKHYTLNRMAIIVVADQTPAYLVRSVKEVFEKLPSQPQALTDFAYKIDSIPDLKFSLSTDDDFGMATVGYEQITPLKPEKTLRDYNNFVIRNLTEQAINFRLNALINSGKANWEDAYFGTDYFFGQTRSLDLVMRTKAGKELESFKSLIEEIERLKQYGFTVSEFNRALASHRAWVKTLDVEDMDLKSDDFAEEYTRNFMYDEPVPGVTNERVYITNVLNTLTLDMLNAYMREMLKDFTKGFIYVRTKPQYASLKQENFAKLIKEAISKKYEPFVSTEKDVGLYDNLLPPGKIAAEETFYNDFTKLVLSNGAVVYVKPTSYDKDAVKIFAFAQGGYSALPEQDVMPARLLSYLMNAAGYSDISSDKINELLAPYRVSLKWNVDSTSQYLIGETKTNDIEPLLRLISLLQTGPGQDVANFNRAKQSILNEIESLDEDPEYRFRNDWQKVLYGDSEYIKGFSVNKFDAITYAQCADLMKRLFGNAAKFTYVIVGDVTLNTLKPLLEKHIASLPGKSDTSKVVWKDLKPQKPTQEKYVFTYAKENKADVVLYFTGSMKYTWESEAIFEILKTSLNNRLLDRIREELSGTYVISCDGSLDVLPKEQYSFIIQFSTDPARVDDLIAAVRREIDAYITGVFDDKYVKQIASQLNRSSGYIYTNDFWLWNTGLTLLYGTNDFSFSQQWLLRSTLATKENIQMMAEKVFNTEYHYVFVLQPPAVAAKNE